MRNQQEQDNQQDPWEQYLATVPKEVMDAVRQDTMEAFTLRFYLRGFFEQQGETDALQPIVDEQARKLASSQKAWGDAPLRKDISSEELLHIRDEVAGNSAQLKETKVLHNAAHQLITENYPELIEMVMKRVRSGRTTQIPEKLVSLLYRSEEKQPMAMFGDTLFKTFKALFEMPEVHAPSLPAPVQHEPITEKPREHVSVQPTKRKSETAATWWDTITWRDIGLTDPSETQGYRNALNDLKKQYVEYLQQSGAPREMFQEIQEALPLQLIPIVKRLDEVTVYNMLGDTFQGPKTERSIARLLILLELQQGEMVPEMAKDPAYLDHAIKIKNGKAETLFPMRHPAEEIYVQSDSGKEPQLKGEIRTDRFPETDEEIVTFIREQVTEINAIMKEKGKTSLDWPMNAAQFSNVARGINKRLLEKESKSGGHVPPDEVRGETPYFELISFIKLRALEQYQRTNAHILKKALKRFDEIYADLRQRKLIS
jgi:hypothetical protein